MQQPCCLTLLVQQMSRVWNGEPPNQDDIYLPADVTDCAGFMALLTRLVCCDEERKIHDLEAFQKDSEECLLFVFQTKTDRNTLVCIKVDKFTKEIQVYSVPKNDALCEGRLDWKVGRTQH